MSRYDELRGDHVRTCFAGAVGAARRGRAQDEWADSMARAARLLADDPTQCTCPRNGRRGRTRARGWTGGERR